MLQVDRRDRDEHDAESGREQRVGREPEAERTAGDEHSGGKLDDRIAKRDVRRTVATAAAEDKVGEKRNVIARRNLRSAAHARRPGLDERAVEGKPSGDDVEEAANREPRSCERRREGDAHVQRLAFRRAIASLSS